MRCSGTFGSVARAREEAAGGGGASPLERPLWVACALAAASLVLSAWMLGYRVPPSDEGAVLTQAARILDGGVYYRDIDAYPLPGASYLLALALALFGEHVAVARSLAALVFAVVVVSLYAAALRVVSPRRAALFGAALLGLKCLAWPAFTSFLYADVAFALACVSVALLVRHAHRGPTLALVAAGASAGAALLCKQTVGMYLAAASAALLLMPQGLLGIGRRPWGARLREAGAYALGAVLPLAPPVAYFSSEGVLDRMIYSGFVRPFTAYLPTSGISFWAPLRWWETGTLDFAQLLPYSIEPLWQMLRTNALPFAALRPLYSIAGEIVSRALYTSVPIAFAGLAVLWVRRRRAGTLASERALLAFGVLAGAVFLSAFPRADFSHVIVVYPMVALLLMALAGRPARAGLGDAGRARWRRAERVALGVGLCASFGLTAWQHTLLTHRMRLERADLWISPENAYTESIVRYVRKTVPAGEPIFVFVHEAHVYFLADRYSPWPFVQLYPGMTGRGGGEDVVAALERDPPRLVVSSLIGAPGLPPLAEYAPRLAQHLGRSYVRDPRAFREYPPAGGVAYETVLKPVPEELRAGRAGAR